MKQINVRMPEDFKRWLKVEAANAGMSVNALVMEMLSKIKNKQDLERGGTWPTWSSLTDEQKQAAIRCTAEAVSKHCAVDAFNFALDAFNDGTAIIGEKK